MLCVRELESKRNRDRNGKRNSCYKTVNLGISCQVNDFPICPSFFGINREWMIRVERIQDNAPDFEDYSHE
ncbi:hypothetical protein KQX54_002898 [Cotesia glomerata]|uniref:Uncharacterized protein n=1 Tax=Cotesia glomerata TaxID=32391 RepID=A0AAV7IWB2_COTGL|nr:hypothetical protein KQX54_002898 [Cotesia glomerata]